MRILVAATLTALLPSLLTAQTTLITFEEPGLTAMGNAPGAAVPAASRLSNQFLATRGISFSSTAGFVAVVVHGGNTPSVPNIIGGTNATGALAYAQPITIRFFDPADPTQPATTSYFRVRGDTSPLGSGTGTVQAFAIDGTALGSQTLPDVAPGMVFTHSFTAPGIHRIVITETSGTVGWDNVEFLPPQRAANYVAYGTGCAGALGVPTLAALPGSLPLPGTTFTARIGNAPNGIAVMVTGLSDAQSGGLPLPLPLTALGMPGCQLLAEALVLDVVTGTNAQVPWSLAVPPGNALLGVRFFNQGFTLDPTANAFGFATSNAAAATIGS